MRKREMERWLASFSFCSSSLPQRMAESSFRQNLAGCKFAYSLIDYQTNSIPFSVRWAQGVTDDSTPSTSTEQSPFYTRFTSSLSSGIPLRSSERSNEEEAYFALSRWERFLGFLICTAGAAACFMLSFFIGLPLLAVKPRKFAVSRKPILLFP